MREGEEIKYNNDLVLLGYWIVIAEVHLVDYFNEALSGLRSCWNEMVF